MAFHFPSSPTVNQLYSAYGADFIYNGYAWVRLAVTSAGPTGPTGPAGATTIGTDGYGTAARAGIASITAEAARQFIFTAGYATAGDGGHGLYKRLQSAPSAPTNKAYARSTDRYRADGSTDATHGGYWALVPDAGQVQIEQFGGKADWTGTPGTSTDNYQPLLDAIAFTARTVTSVELFSYRINLGFGEYYFSQTIDIHTHTHICGMGRGGVEEGGTKLWFPSTQTCFIINQNNTTGDSTSGTGYGSGNCTVIEALSIQHYFASGAFSHLVEPSAFYGVHMRGVGSLINLWLARMSGTAVYISGFSGATGALEGAPNQWRVRDVTVHSATGHGLHVIGSDANAGFADGFATQTEVGGCGIYNESYFVNTYSGIHIAGYGNRGVRVGSVVGVSRIYQLIGGYGTTTPNTTTPGTNNRIWYDLGTYNGSANHDQRFPVWSATPTAPHSYHSPIWDSGGGSVYTGVYVENSTLFAHVPPPSMVINGTISMTMYSGYIFSTTGIVASRQGIGGYQTFIDGTPEFTANGANSWVAVGVPNETNGLGAGGGLGWLTSRRLSDVDGSWNWGFAGNSLDFKAPGGTSIWSIGTRYSTRAFGRTLGIPYKLGLFDPILEDVTNSTNGRILGMRVAQPADAGEYARGDRWYNANASAGGFEGWVVTTTGAIHNVVWSSGVGFDNNTWLKNSANRVYRYISGGTGISTSQPVHTSGTVTAADGAVWTWVADGPPVFKQFGTIAA